MITGTKLGINTSAANHYAGDPVITVPKEMLAAWHSADPEKRAAIEKELLGAGAFVAGYIVNLLNQTAPEAETSAPDVSQAFAAATESLAKLNS